MSQRKAFLLRIDPAILDAVQQWADDDLRSLNGQIEFLLRKALRDAHRSTKPAQNAAEAATESKDGESNDPINQE